MRTLSSILTALLLAVLIPIWVVSYNVAFSLYQADFYKDALQQSGIYVTVVDEAVTRGLARLPAHLPPGPKKELETELRTFARKTIAQDLLRHNTEHFLDLLQAWLNSDRPASDFNPAFDLQSFKPRARRELETRVAGLVQGLPTCPPTLLRPQSPLGGESDCLPVLAKVQLQALLLPMARAFIAGLPDRTDFRSLAGKRIASVERDLERARALRVRARIAFAVLSTTVLLLLAGLGALHRDSLGRLFAWLGAVLLVPCALLLIAGPLTAEGARLAIEQADLPRIFALAVPPLVSSFSQQLLLPAYVLAGLAVACLVSGWLFGRRGGTEVR